MSTFKRGIKLEPLKAMADAGDNWWCDLLRAWAPSGESRSDGLRLAIRHNYMNFYLQGQSVALVGYGRHLRGQTLPYAEMHSRYVGIQPRSGNYIRYATDGMPINAAEAHAGAKGTVAAWIEGTRKSETAGDEKVFLDDVVSASADVIDLEMGIPRQETREEQAIRQRTAGVAEADIRYRSSFRIDLVSLEAGVGGAPQLVFWEGKLINDDRMVAEANRDVEVIDQMDKYRKFLEKEHESVIVAYQQHCAALAALLDMRDQLLGTGPTAAVSLLRQVAEGAPLGIDTRPRLLVLNEGANAARLGHMQRLKDAKLELRYMHQDGSRHLADATKDLVIC